MPIRIQRKRTKGWRMPKGAVCVTRPGKWGNTFSVSEYGVKLSVFNHRQRMRNLAMVNPHAFDELRGKDLACWCHLCEKHRDGKPMGVECSDCAPCHADVLLEIANRIEEDLTW
jgi:hypothetical protein